MKTTLYVGCSLTQAPQSFRTEVEHFKDQLRDHGYEVLDFVGLVAGSSADVYRWDIGHCVHDCDALVAICDEPSIGLGWELGEAVRLGKPVLALAHHDAKITRLLLGAAEAEANLHLRRYTKLADAIVFVDQLVETRPHL